MKKHPTLPFLTMGRWFDLEPDLAKTTDHCVGPDEWLVIFGPGGIPEMHSWPSEAEAIAGALPLLLNDRVDLVEKHLELAKRANDIELLVRLVDAKARHEAHCKTRNAIAQALATARHARAVAEAAVDTALRTFMVADPTSSETPAPTAEPSEARESASPSAGVSTAAAQVTGHSWADVNVAHVNALVDCLLPYLPMGADSTLTLLGYKPPYNAGPVPDGFMEFWVRAPGQAEVAFSLEFGGTPIERYGFEDLSRERLEAIAREVEPVNLRASVANFDELWLFTCRLAERMCIKEVQLRYGV